MGPSGNGADSSALPLGAGDRLSPGPSTSNNNKGKRPSLLGGEDHSNASLSREQLLGLRRQSNLSTLSLSPRRRSTGTSATATKPTRSRFAPQDESVESIQTEREDQDGDWTMIDRMRNWRNDAMTQHLYGTAQFWGSKVFALTGASLQLVGQTTD